LGAAVGRQRVEARFDDGEQGTASSLLEAELDQRGWLARVVDGRIDGVGVPPVGEQSLGLDALHLHVPGDGRVARDRDAPADGGAYREFALERHAEPGAKLPGLRERAPHSCPRSTELDLLLDAIGSCHDNLLVAMTMARLNSLSNCLVAFTRHARGFD